MRVASRPLATLLLPVAAAAAFLLAFASLGPTATNAAGGSITVIRTSQQVNYPSGVGLSITVESEEEIDEVRVYYRAAGSRQWGYAYAEFDPGTNIVATQSVPASEVTYIAPGADVEYYFEVRDVEGNVVKTAQATVEYLDDRFDWERVTIGPLELIYHDIGDSQLEETVRKLTEDLRRVEQLLQLEQTRSFKGVVYNDYSDANAAFPVQSQTTTDHGTFAGYAFPEQRVFVGQGLDRRIIVHESTHLMFRDSIRSRSVEIPAWLNEGFATYMEPTVRVRSARELYQRTPHLKAMTGLSGTPQTIPLFYQKSVSVVAHLIEAYGEDRFRLFIGEMSRGRETEEALVSVYGFDVHGLDASWAGLPIPDPVVVEALSETAEDNVLATSEPQPQPENAAVVPPQPVSPADASRTDSSTAVPREPGQRIFQPNQATATPQGGPSGQSQQPRTQPQGDSPSPFIFFDAWILAGVALVAVAAVTARFLYSRLRRWNEGADDSRDSWRDDYIDDD